MRINIIGPSGSGKTTLANTISTKYHIPVTHLDYLFYIHKPKNMEEVLEKEWRKQLHKVLNEKDWIIEGVNPINEVLDSADIIIYLRPRLTTAIYRQWKRYFTDSKQRREHGFKNNLKLTQYLIRQFKENEDLTRENDIKYSRLKKLDRILGKHTTKLKIIKNNKDIKNLISSL